MVTQMASPEHRLLERERELEALHKRLDAAATGRGGVLLLEGPAGVGKSALLRELATLARAADVRALGAIGGELEREYPFGMVRQLLEPELRAASPERRERLLSGAAAVAAPLVGATAQEDAGADGSFATLHGLYWLVAALSDEQPLLLVLDDAHWADAASLRFVDFLARRVAELPLLVALGVRPREPGSETDLLDAIADGDHAVAVRPGPLSPAAVGALVADRLGPRAGEGVATAAFTATGGNPLLLRELVATLAEDDEKLSAADVEAAVPSSVTRSVQRRLARLPAAAQQVAAALATLGDRGADGLLALACGLDATAVAEGLEALRDVQLVEPGAARFLHPLVRQAIADGVPAAQRHRLHADAARALHARDGASEAVVVHLLARPPLGEPWASEALREGGRRALAEGAPESAVRRLTRAVEEQAGAAVPALQLALGEAMMSAGDPRAAGVLARAVEAEDPVLAARAVQALVAAENLAGSFDGEITAQRLERAIERLGPGGEREVADALTAMLISVASIDGALASRGRALAEAGNERGLPALASLHAIVGACGATPAAEVVAQARTALGPEPFARLSQVEAPSSWFAVGALHLVGAFDEAERALAAAEATARRHGSRLARGYVLLVRAHTVQLGQVRDGEANAREAAALWADAGLEILADSATMQVVSALVLRGRLDEAEATLTARPLPSGVYVRAQALSARAQLRLAQRRPEEALRDVREAHAIVAELGFPRPAWGFAGVQLAQTLGAAGQLEEARAVAREQVALARDGQRPAQLAAALTALGALLSGDEQLDAYAAAVAIAPSACAPLPHATARVELGAALRRRGQRQEARGVLREGHELAARAGLQPLETRALEELVVAGGKPRSRYSSGVEALTPSERRVAEHAAAGLSNREIAETLFVTRKTVELHLGRAYGKLGIRSRVQLPEALGIAATG